MDQLVALIVDEGKWLTASMSVALVAVVVLLRRHRALNLQDRGRVLAAMSLFFGVTIGTMAFGHLLAVTARLASGTLEGAVARFYLIGVALAVPSWWLILRTRRLSAGGEAHGRATLALNGWLTLTLLALGLQNLPLAVPGLLNIAYHLHTGRALGRAIVATAVVVNLGLFIGSVIFLASGQSFEQFRESY